MKLSDYIAQFIHDHNGRHVFAISGGASLHLIHSVHAQEGLHVVCTHHEQAAAMAADAYARIDNNLGVAMVTSGPGATNLITGICCSFFDSIPTLFITGQVATFRSSEGTGIRQIGFQETDIVEMVKPVTKYAVKIKNPNDISRELEKAVCIMRDGRPGPVLVDVPDDLQRAEIDPDKLVPYEPEADLPSASEGTRFDPSDIFAAIREAERPVIVAGWGIRLAGSNDDFLNLIGKLDVPVLPTWGVADMVPADHPLLVGTFGTHGTRFGNFCVQNADLVISLGSRLDTHVTGSPLSSFAREAKKFIVDIDKAELGKFSSEEQGDAVLINCDVADVIKAMLESGLPGWERRESWTSRIAAWRQNYPQVCDEYFDEDTVNPYAFVKTLSSLVSANEIITCDTGCAIAWMMQAFEFQSGQRFFHAFNNTPMGYSLPAAIATSLSRGKARTVCVCGDGGFQMNIQELATLAHQGLPVKIFVMNNNGYSMIQQTQDQWLNSEYIASSPEGGLSMPDFVGVAKGYGIPAERISTGSELSDTISKVLDAPGPMLCDVIIPSEHRVIPQVKFGRPIEDTEPLLPRDEFLENMIVAPLDVSRP